jgi:hypothetical protein
MGDRYLDEDEIGVPAHTQGQKDDGGKLPMDLLAYDALKGTAQVLAFGAEKYAPRNWEKGIEYSRVFAALQRHMTAWWMGEDLDPETGLSHLHHAGCCIMFLQAFNERGMSKFDDRPGVVRGLNSFEHTEK